MLILNLEIKHLIYSINLKNKIKMAINSTLIPDEFYNRKRFVSEMYRLGQLEQILKGLKTPEGNWDPNLRKALGYLARDNQSFYNELNPALTINDADEAKSNLKKVIERYSKNKVDILLSKIDGEDVPSVLFSVPLVKTGINKYDRIKQIIDEKTKIAKAEQEGNIAGYVNEKLSKASDWRKKAYENFGIGSSSYDALTFNEYKRSTEMDFRRVIMTQDGKIDRTKLLNLIKANYEQIIKNEEENEDEPEKNGENSKVARNFRYAIAKYAFQGELKRSENVQDLIKVIHDKYDTHYDIDALRQAA